MPRSDEKWQEAAESAKFLVDFQRTYNKMDIRSYKDLKDLINEASGPQSVSKTSIF